MAIISPTFVLVPGAWQGGWAWQPVARRLREAGYAAVTVTLPGLADGDDRAGLYDNAVVLARGTAMVDENAGYAALTRAAIAASPDGTIGLVREQVPMLMPEADEQARDLFFELLVPQPGGYFLDPLDADDVTTLGVPAAYVLSEDDRALARPGAEFASRIGLTPVLVPGGHESMLTRPDEVAKALLASALP